MLSHCRCLQHVCPHSPTLLFSLQRTLQEASHMALHAQHQLNMQLVNLSQKQETSKQSCKMTNNFILEQTNKRKSHCTFLKQTLELPNLYDL